MNTHQHTDQQPTAMTDTHKKPFVHLAYRKIMIDHLPLVFFGGMARDRQGHLLDLTHGGWNELQVGQHPRQRYFPLLDPGETRVIRPEQDVWDHLVLLQPASEGEKEQA